MLYTRHWQWVCSQNGIDGSIPSLAISLSHYIWWLRHFLTLFRHRQADRPCSQNPVNK
nr:MAG TPA: hypothetical protein [Caudoviricetes sp.]